MTLRLALDPARDAILAGIAYEHYPRSGCGLVTYLVVAPEARGQGLGERLLREATQELYARGAPAVFGEVNDPRVHHSRVSRGPDGDGPDDAWPRLVRFQRWGARVVATRYVQPALGPGLVRDRGLVLIALAGPTPLPPRLPGCVVDAFVRELYEVTEGGPPDPEVRVPEWVDLQSWDAR